MSELFQKWKADIPVMDKTVGIILFILNIVFVGLGTILISFLGGKCRVEQVLVAVLQWVTTPLFLLGWIWSIYWGFLIYEKSRG